MAERYFIGIDGGTEGLRAGVFDDRGRPRAFAASPYQTRFPQPGWAEQDPGDWWTALAASVRRAVAEAGIAAGEVAGLAVDATSCSVVALDGRGQPLRPAMIWMDVRSSDQARRIAACGGDALRVNGAGHGPVSAEWLLPKALWLKENELEVYKEARTICEYVDYLNHRLTGRMVASLNNASIRWHYDESRGGFQASLLEAANLSELLERFPKEVLPMGEVIGGLTGEAAADLGLPAGLPVAQGGADAFVAMVGLGVVRPGQLAFVTGSSHLHLGLSEHAFHAPGLWGSYGSAVVPGLHVIEGGQTSTGSVVNWFRSMLSQEESFEALNARAAALPPGAEGLVVLEHFQGNRTPYTDPDSRGVISGLSLKHGPEHIFRAIIEGVAFGSELILETMRTAGFTPRDIVICGGATRSELWLQIHADVSNLPLSLTEVADAPALGAAVLAAVGAGHYPDSPCASEAMVQRSRTVEPDSARHEAYRTLYSLYKDLYPTVADTLHRQVAIAKASGKGGKA